MSFCILYTGRYPYHWNIQRPLGVATFFFSMTVFSGNFWGRLLKLRASQPKWAVIILLFLFYSVDRRYENIHPRESLGGFFIPNELSKLWWFNSWKSKGTPPMPPSQEIRPSSGLRGWWWLINPYKAWFLRGVCVMTTLTDQLGSSNGFFVLTKITLWDNGRVE